MDEDEDERESGEEEEETKEQWRSPDVFAELGAAAAGFRERELLVTRETLRKGSEAVVLCAPNLVHTDDTHAMSSRFLGCCYPLPQWQQPYQLFRELVGVF